MRKLEHTAFLVLVVIVMAPVLLQLADAALPTVLAILAVLWLARMLWPLR